MTLARLAGRPLVGVCCEIAAPDVEMARLPELDLFAAAHGLPMLAIDDLVAFVKDGAAEARVRDAHVAG